MKLQSKLALAFAGTLIVAAIAGCPTTTTPGVTPTPTPTPTPAPAKLKIEKISFNTAAGASQGRHELTIKNVGDMDLVDLNKYMVAYHPTGTDAVATSSILNSSDAAMTSLAKGTSMKVFLYTNATPSTTAEAKVSFPANSVQYTRGGGLALFNSTATTSANIVDFVKWGTVTSDYEPVAVAAKLWGTGTTVATVSIDSKQGATLTMKSATATGSTNFEFTTF